MSSTTRRTFIKGLALGASAALLDPITRQLQAHAEGVLPKPRVVFVVEGNGMNESHVVPTMAVDALRAAGVDRANAGSKSYGQDSPLIVKNIDHIGAKALEPLKDHLNKVAVVSGLSCRVIKGGHSSDFGVLTNAPGSPGGISIDQHLAKKLRTTKPYDHIALGMSERAEHVNYITTAPGPGKRGAVYTNPLTSRNMLFGSVANEQGMKAFEQRANLLDFITKDVTRYQRALGAQERLKLDHYLHAVDVMANRQTKIEAMRETLLMGLPPETNIYTAPQPGLRLEATFELIAASLILGLTDVALICSGTSERLFSVKFTDFGEDIPGKHTFGHGGAYQSQGAGFWMGNIHALHTTLIARLIDKLEATPEGDGNMMDNTLIVFINDAGNAHHNRNENWPAILVSGKNIPLHTDGRCILYPREGKDKHRHLGALWNTIAHAVGHPVDDFGADPSPNAQGPLPELFG